MKYIKTLSLLITLFSSSIAFAGGGGSMEHGPLTAAPTLSGTMLIILSLLLAAVAIRIMKQNTSGSVMLLGVIGVAALMSAGGGIKLISDVDAGNFNLSNPNGGTINFGLGFHAFENTSGVPQQILGIELRNCSFGDNIDASTSALSTSTDEAEAIPFCQVSSILEESDICVLSCGGRVGLGAE